MLEELDAINWHKLTHAYGAADDVPGQIRALASKDEETSKKAMYDLYGNIWHQGTVYEATAYAVPFLIELVQHDTVQRRDEILVLLVHLAYGNSYIDVHQHSELFQETHKEEMQSEEWQATLDRELSWVQKAHEAVRKGIPVYLDLMKHPDPALRTTAAYTLAGFQASDSTITQQLWEALPKEEDTITRASIMLALEMAPNTELPIQAYLTDLLNHETDALIKTTAAMSMVRLAQHEAPQVAVATLVEAMKNPQPITEAYEQLPWADGGVIADVSAYLQLLGTSVAEAVVPLLAQILDSTNVYGALTVAQTLLYLAFAGKPMNEGTQFQELNNLQQLALTAINDSQTVWKINVNMSHIMQSFNLPDWPDKLHTFVQNTPAT